MKFLGHQQPMNQKLREKMSGTALTLGGASQSHNEM